MRIQAPFDAIDLDVARGDVRLRLAERAARPDVAGRGVQTGARPVRAADLGMDLRQVAKPEPLVLELDDELVAVQLDMRLLDRLRVSASSLSGDSRTRASEPGCVSTSMRPAGILTMSRGSAGIWKLSSRMDPPSLD